MDDWLVILIGGNLGEVNERFKKVRTELANSFGKILKVSSVYATEAWGGETTNQFLNQVIVFNNLLSPQEVLEICLQIEKKYGRDRMQEDKWGDRTIDIDILYYGHKIVNDPNLIIPHPQIPYRKFVLIPLVEIMDTFVHPTLECTQNDLLKKCSDKLAVDAV